MLSPNLASISGYRCSLRKCCSCFIGTLDRFSRFLKHVTFLVKTKQSNSVNTINALWLHYAKWAQLLIRQSTVHCLNLLDMSEVATTSVISVLVILKIPKVP